MARRHNNTITILKNEKIESSLEKLNKAIASMPVEKQVFHYVAIYLTWKFYRYFEN